MLEKVQNDFHLLKDLHFYTLGRIWQWQRHLAQRFQYYLHAGLDLSALF